MYFITQGLVERAVRYLVESMMVAYSGFEIIRLSLNSGIFTVCLPVR